MAISWDTQISKVNIVSKKGDVSFKRTDSETPANDWSISFSQVPLETTAERLALLDEAIKLETQILKRNEDIAKQKLQIKLEQDKLSNSTKEDLEEETRLEVELINLKTQSANTQRKLQSERLSVAREVRPTPAKRPGPMVFRPPAIAWSPSASAEPRDAGRGEGDWRAGSLDFGLRI